MRRVFLFALLLGSVVVARADVVSFVRVWPKWRDAASFERISEYFTGRENTGSQVILRTQPATRPGFYFLARVRNSGAVATRAKIVLSLIKPDSPKTKTYTFPITLPTGQTVYDLGLTGTDWVGPKVHPVAWKIEVFATDGTLLGAEKVFFGKSPTSERRHTASRPRLVPWQPMPLGSPLRADVLSEILDGGQAFRWRCENAVWLGVFGSNAVRLTLAARGTLHWSAPTTIAKGAEAALVHYLDAGRDPPELADALPWRSDAHLATCLAAFPRLRILRQPFGETLLGFLCSATKQIVQIKQMIALLAERHGTALLTDPSPMTSDVAPALRRLPTWPELALIPEAELRACQFGFRARFINQTALFLAAHPNWLETTEALPYAAAKQRLCSLPGVGEKIADCVLLFGAHRLEAFPVDTWILKAMSARYGLQGWKPAQVAQFGRAHFGPLAGLAQQYLFSWERKHGGTQVGADR